MLNNYLKVALRNLTRHKTFSIINILGFAFGISVCLLIALFLIKEYSFDSFNVNEKHIYKLIDKEDNSSAIDYRVAHAILENYPEVEYACVTATIPSSVGVGYNNNGYDLKYITSANNAFFKVFTTHFIAGDPSKPLPNPNSVVLTESTAQEIFGSENPLGKTVMIWHLIPVTVTGVIKDFPDNSSLNANMIVSIDNNYFRRFYFSCENSQDTSTYRYLTNIYLQLSKYSDASGLLDKINSHPGILQPYVKKVRLLALKDVYLYDNSDGISSEKGNPQLLSLFLAVGVIVLLLAVINYVNLSVSQQSKRNKETGIRKTVGAGRKDVIFLFLTESILVTFVASLIALGIVEVSLSAFCSIVNTDLSLRPLMHFPGNLILLISVVAVGVLSGIGPSLLFSSFSPVTILGGKIIPSGKKSSFRNLLTVFQFTVSIALIFCIIVIQRQIRFAENANLGFDREQLLTIHLPMITSEAGVSKVGVLTNKLKEYTVIRSVCSSNGVPGQVHNYMGSGVAGKNQSIACILADKNFVSTFGIKEVKGRGLLLGEYGQVCMMNETAYKYFGWSNLYNKIYHNGRSGGYKVIGVVKDFNIASLHQPIEPTCIMFTSYECPTNVTLRIQKGKVPEVMADVREAWKEVYPDYPLNYRFYDMWFNQMYRNDERFAGAIGMFAGLAITISCLGILGLAIFASERRAKEIGIRKVHGASVRDLMILLNRDFIKWISVAFIIGCPIGWYAMNKWLQTFAYKAQISWWIFVISGIIALVIALLTVSWLTWRAATANPVESLRYE